MRNLIKKELSSSHQRKKLVNWLCERDYLDLSWEEQSQLTYLLKDSDPEIRKKAVFIYYNFRKCPNKKAIDFVKPLLYDKDFEVAYSTFCRIYHRTKFKFSIQELNRFLSGNNSSEIFFMSIFILDSSRIKAEPEEIEVFYNQLFVKFKDIYHSTHDLESRFWSALVLIFFKKIDSLSPAFTILKTDENTRYEYFYDEVQPLLLWPDSPEWVFKDSNTSFCDELSFREVIAYALIKNYPENSMNIIFDYLKDKFVPSKEKNRVLHAFFECPINYFSIELLQELYDYLDEDSRIEILFLMYYLMDQGEKWDHQNHYLLKHCFFKSSNVQVLNRAINLAIKFGIKFGLESNHIPKRDTVKADNTLQIEGIEK